MQSTVMGEGAIRGVALDASVLAELDATRAALARRGLSVWGEHCTECVMPTCYSACALYTPRTDLKCRRFAHGIESLEAVSGAGARHRLMKIEFRRWGKLEAETEARTADDATAALADRLDRAIAPLTDLPGMPHAVRRAATRKWDKLKGIAARRAAPARQAELFVIEAIGEDSKPADFTLTIKPKDPAEPGLFQTRFTVSAGYTRVCVPADRIFRQLGPARDLLAQIEPVGSDGGAVATFGLVDFVSLRPGVVLSEVAPAKTASKTSAATGATPKVKCVVWDLDNTLWRGTLIEDGVDNLVLNAEAAALIVELDKRGILNSIASKNTGEDAEAALKRFGLRDYFLRPQIHWNPKSASVAQIAKSLNIGIDSLLFVDDQPFERAEVSHAHPEVETLDAAEMGALLRHPRLDVPVTDEAARRRSMYQEEEGRDTLQQELSVDYETFLRHCDLKLAVADVNATNINRVFELTERTNQLNYSGQRLTRAALDDIAAGRGDALGLVLSVTDRFGDYGIIGAAFLNSESWAVEAFFMSCRVQRKKVDHAFFAHLAAIGAGLGKRRLAIHYRKSKKNEPSRVVLEDEMHLSSEDHADGLREFTIDAGRAVPEGDIVQVNDTSVLPTLDASAPAHVA